MASRANDPPESDAPPRPAMVFLVCMGAGVIVFGLAWGYCAIARMPFKASIVVGVAVPFFLFSGFFAFVYKDARFDPVPEPLGRTISDALDQDHLLGARVRTATTGTAKSFPRPIVNWPNIVIPARVLRDWSPEAILWSVRTDARTSYRFARRGAPLLVAAILTMAILSALLRREGFGAWQLGLLGFGLVAVLAGATYYQYRLQVASDATVTRTDLDRRAAREALGYPYRAQRAKSGADKWMFLSGELRGRARRLGINLDAET